jgi:cytochrome P450
VKQTKKCLATIHETRTKLFTERKEAILSEKQDAQSIEDKDLMSLLSEYSGSLFIGLDVLPSLVVKSNLSTDPSKRLSDSDLLDQFSAFLFAGSDSTAIAITWCLHILAINPAIQGRLRDELLSIPLDSPAEGYERLPFLDAVIRETLRLFPPIHGTLREAMQDDLIPVSGEVPLRDGNAVPAGGHIKIRKGTYIHIPIEGLNMNEDVWGQDATQFNPDRWLNPLPPNARSPIFPGLANIMSFSVGPHACPGWKFAIADIKAFVATLLPVFVFRHEEGQDIGKFNAILMRPFDRADWRAGKGLTLPMLISRYEG